MVTREYRKKREAATAAAKKRDKLVMAHKKSLEETARIAGELEAAENCVTEASVALETSHSELASVTAEFKTSATDDVTTSGGVVTTAMDEDDASSIGDDDDANLSDEDVAAFQEIDPNGTAESANIAPNIAKAKVELRRQRRAYRDLQTQAKAQKETLKSANNTARVIVSEAKAKRRRTQAGNVEAALDTSDSRVIASAEATASEAVNKLNTILGASAARFAAN